MKLHENKTLYRQSIQYTADLLKIPAIYIEKDYWVSYALFTIFNNEIGKDTVFKGGTALSKCFNLIERFSEDIDLVVLRREGETNNQLTNKIKKISKVVSEVLPEINITGLTQKMGMNRKTAHSYTKEFKGKHGQVRDFLVVEATWLGYHEPYTVKPLNSFVGHMMLQTGQNTLAETHGMMPFEVKVLEPIRTLCEKIMSLVRFSYANDPIGDLKNKIRHLYDLHQLLLQQEFAIFFYSEAFDKMLLKVAQDDIVSFKNNNGWLEFHPADALIFRDITKVWNDLAPIYTGQFKNLVYGEFPTETLIFETLTRIKERLQTINWTIKLDSTS
ncbi:nucleotidyl transferase AbiEii/AbiGii toxin family protein [Lacihabitans sp. CCS-44]|uniref:nucleotidyl transferase AbiEii/AbiGii toxin family protein n=1 Tax=Lacihabitans sp. CCS-44 TaxID=2487331 RepID=UPI0020CEB15D|nr:nucleotidyl transferase AbiEii/AbiGii toxin family protein [Lacihabitans sp. CCS-44]MCP9755303.1 nucleotidyl transferase AbiEii/AbiGii toxin family protein [Lacihabitans sp. CCS-44]